jgi:hypothetical protein
VGEMKQRDEEIRKKKGDGSKFEINRKITIENENHGKKSLCDCFATSRLSVSYSAARNIVV